jgi:hypothetical protein
VFLDETNTALLSIWSARVVTRGMSNVALLGSGTSGGASGRRTGGTIVEQPYPLAWNRWRGKG